MTVLILLLCFHTVLLYSDNVVFQHFKKYPTQLLTITKTLLQSSATRCVRSKTTDTPPSACGPTFWYILMSRLQLYMNMPSCDRLSMFMPNTNVSDFGSRRALNANQNNTVASTLSLLLSYSAAPSLYLLTATS